MTPPTTHAEPDEPRDLFSILEAEARAVAAAFGVPTANELAAALIDRVQLRLHHGRIYAPKRSRLRVREVHENMRRQYDGTNINEWAKAHGYSRSQAYKILKKK